MQHKQNQHTLKEFPTFMFVGMCVYIRTVFLNTYTWPAWTTYYYLYLYDLMDAHLVLVNQLKSSSPEKTISPPSQHSLVAHSSLSRVEVSQAFPFHISVLLFRSFFRRPCFSEFMDAASLIFLGDTAHSNLPVPQALTVFLPLLPQWSPIPGYGNCAIDIPVETGHLMISYSLFFGQLWFSVMISIAKRSFSDDGKK